MSDFIWFIVGLFLLMLAIATILLPLIIWDMHTHLGKVRKTLEAMEHMMRHGK